MPAGCDITNHCLTAYASPALSLVSKMSFLPELSWHKCPLMHCGFCAQPFMTQRQVYWSIPLNASAKSSIWETIESIACNFVDYLHIPIDYHVVSSLLTLSYHSMVTIELRYWLHPINKDKSAQLLPHHNSWWSHQSVVLLFLHPE